MPENTGEIQARGRFQRGRSGNPKGKPKGTRNQASLLAEKLFSDEIEGICNVVIEQAKSGDIQAAKIVLDRLFPARKDNPIQIDLPKMESAAGLLEAIGKITQAVASGQILPSAGDSLARLIDTQAKVLELQEFDRRLTLLEEQNEDFK